MSAQLNKHFDHSVTNMSPKKERAWLLQEKYAGVETPAFADDLLLLAAGVPLAYVIGHVPFLSASIDLSHKPLIPRVETEHWVAETIAELRARDRAPQTILDLFSGSGCIGVALAQAFPGASVHFAEYDASLIPNIEENIRRNIADPERIKVFQSDIFSNVHDRYDMITANPPYIPESRRNALDASVTDFEPHQALFGGEDGLAFIRPLIAEAPQFLNPGGSLFIEFDSAQKDVIEDLARASEAWREIRFIRDQYDAWRAVELVRA